MKMYIKKRTEIRQRFQKSNQKGKNGDLPRVSCRRIINCWVPANFDNERAIDKSWQVNFSSNSVNHT